MTALHTKLRDTAEPSMGLVVVGQFDLIVHNFCSVVGATSVSNMNCL